MIERISDSAADDPSLDADDSPDPGDRPSEGANGDERVQRPGPLEPRRRATAQSMAASQRDICVSEFFAKNRHLLGFDNPRKALLTTVKEAVDNALDACEEAGILPEIWVHIRAHRAGPLQGGRPGQRARHPARRQIPLIFGKLLYGSKFHRMRMSRGQQGIGISAAGMYGLLTTGKPVKIMSKISQAGPGPLLRNPDRHEAEPAGNPQRPRRRAGDPAQRPRPQRRSRSTRIEWIEADHGTRVTIELEARYQRGRGSVDEYLEQTAIANPHVTIHYVDPDGATWEQSAGDARPCRRSRGRSSRIPTASSWGCWSRMLKDTKAPTVSQFLTHSFSRVSPAVARRICEAAKVSTRASTRKCGRHEADQLYQAIQKTKISAPATDCIAPIGEELILRGLHQVVPGEFYAAATPAPGGLSRQSLPHRGRPGLRRRVAGAEGLARGPPRTARSQRRPHAAAVPLDHLRRRRRRGRRQDLAGGRPAARGRRPASSRRRKSPSSTRRCGTSTCTTASR